MNMIGSKYHPGKVRASLALKQYLAVEKAEKPKA
jgi:hypothetical protein